MANMNIVTQPNEKQTWAGQKLLGVTKPDEVLSILIVWQSHHGVNVTPRW